MASGSNTASFAAVNYRAHRHREHVVLLSLTDGCKGELITSSGIGVRGRKQEETSVCCRQDSSIRQRWKATQNIWRLYVDPSLITKAASETQLSGSFEIAERYTRADKVISSVGMALLGELDSEGLSGRLYAESLGNVLAVHLLRYYANATSRPVTFTGGLSAKSCDR